jgi:hypothetical protein
LHNPVQLFSPQQRLAETAKTAINIGEDTPPRAQLHNFRVTPLCTTCTRLMNKKLQSR